MRLLNLIEGKELMIIFIHQLSGYETTFTVFLRTLFLP